MIEQKMAHIQMINLRGVDHDENLVRLLRQKFAQDGESSGLVLVSPRKSPMERYRIVANAEIVLAAKSAGLESVWVLEGDWPDGLRPIMPVLNVPADSGHQAREVPEPEGSEPEGPIELAKRFQAAVEEYGSQYKAADALGVPRTTLKNSLYLLRLDKKIQKALSEGSISESAARTIALTPDKEHQKRIYSWYRSSSSPHSRSPTIRDLESAIRAIANEEGDPTIVSALIERFCQEFSETHGVEMNYVATGLGGWSTIKFAEAGVAASVYACLFRLDSSDIRGVTLNQNKDLVQLRFHSPSSEALERNLKVIDDCMSSR